jgi:hypothetical protein
MSTKLGQLLIKEGLLTSEQLEETLKSQVIFSGRLGTNLIELGYLDEQQIAQLLSKKLGVPAADRDQLNDVPPELISLIPAAIVKKYLAIPLSLDRKRLTVAMADPSDLAAIDELAFLTGYIIIPQVAPELVLMNAMERYYGLKRETRYIAMSRDTRTRVRQGRADTEEQETFIPAAAPYEPTDDTIELPPISNFKGFDKMGEPAVTAPPQQELLDSSTEDSLAAACTRLAEATSRDAIAEALLLFLGQKFGLVALFLVRGENVTGWGGMSAGLAVEQFSEVNLALATAPSLAQVVQEKRFYMGPLVGEVEKTAYAALGGTAPAAVLQVPLVLANRVVALLTVGDSLEKLTKELPLLQRLAGKAVLAFEILILKNKILLL